MLKDTHQAAQFDACLLVVWEYAGFAGPISSLLESALQAGTPSTGNPVSTDRPLSSMLISTS